MSFRWHFRTGRAYGRRDFEGASAACREMLVKDPRNGFAIGTLAQCYAGMGRPRDALGAAEQALQILPDNFEMLRLATDLAFQLNEHARARIFAERALAAPRTATLPRAFVRLLRFAAHIPALRAWFDPKGVAELDSDESEREQWRVWATKYLEWHAASPALPNPPAADPL